MRDKAIAAVTNGLYDDAGEIVAAIVAESKHAVAWRPVRAAALAALAQVNDGRAWMTLAEFEAWRERLGFNARTKTAPKLRAMLGMGKDRVKAIQSGVPITALEALSCAHYAMGLELPFPAEDPDAFAAWVGPRFGAVDPVARWLGIRGDFITDRMRGFDLEDGRRVVRVPKITLIRSLDWVWRVGPFCPYGERPPVAMWPGQEVRP